MKKTTLETKQNVNQSIKRRKETKNKTIHMNLRVELYDREVERDLVRSHENQKIRMSYQRAILQVVKMARRRSPTDPAGPPTDAL